MRDGALTPVSLGARLRGEREARAVPLQALADAAGVSRSMISAVERGEKVPTVLVLDRLATALGTSLARLFAVESEADVVVLRRAEQDVVSDPSGWERRILSPVVPGVEFEFMRTTLGPGADAGTFPAHGPGAREYVAVERGRLRLTLSGVMHELGPGDSIYFAGDRPHGFANASAGRECHYYLAMDVSGRRSRHG